MIGTAKHRSGLFGATRAAGGEHSRFTDHTHRAPNLRAASLSPNHPAVVDGTTIFQSTIKTAATTPRLLVSGFNSSKLGKEVMKGPWRGAPIFHLTLVERETCPRSCAVWDACYGNAMPAARRHRYTEDLPIRLGDELQQLARDHRRTGFVVRLHNLGDFPTVQYAQQWLDWMYDLPPLRVFDYTAHPIDSEIGRVVATGNSMFPDRWAMRFSVAPGKDMAPGYMEATTIWREPDGPRVPEGLVCPAQTNKTATCGTCGLCWSPSMADTRIVFLGHGMTRHVGPRKPVEAKAPKMPIDPPQAPSIEPKAPSSLPYVIADSRARDHAFLTALRAELDHHVRSQTLIQAMITVWEMRLATPAIEDLPAPVADKPVLVTPKAPPVAHNPPAVAHEPPPRAPLPPIERMPGTNVRHVGRPRDGGPLILTDERRELLRLEYPAGVNIKGIVERFNMLPGPGATSAQIGIFAAAHLKLRRPPGFDAKMAPMTLNGPTAEVIPSTQLSVFPCEGCGGPRSKYSRQFCRPCFVKNGQEVLAKIQAEREANGTSVPNIIKSGPETGQKRPGIDPAEAPQPEVRQIATKRDIPAGQIATNSDKTGQIATTAPIEKMPEPETAIEAAIQRAITAAPPAPKTVPIKPSAPPPRPVTTSPTAPSAPAPKKPPLTRAEAMKASAASWKTPMPAHPSLEEPISVDFEQVRSWAGARGINFEEWDDLPVVNRKREYLGLPLFKRSFAKVWERA